MLNDADMRQQPRASLVPIMIFRLFSAKALSEPVLEYCQLDPWEFFDQYLNIFTQENTSENAVFEIATILSRLQCVNH